MPEAEWELAGEVFPRGAAYPRREPRTDRAFWINSVVRDEQFLYVDTTFGYARVRAP